MAGLPMTSGFQGWKNYYPPVDAPVVRKVRAAGGIILAKASLSEFTRGIGDNINSVLPGFARNPYNTAYATGGSSGGTGASVAASFGVVGIGKDTGGSVRAPSAHNALVGLRPTVGLVSTAGMTPNNSVRDTTGPMARSVADLVILLDVMAGLDPEDPVTARAEGHRLPTYTGQLKTDALKGARLGCCARSSARRSPIRGSLLSLKPRWPSSKPTTLQSRATGNENAATVAALAASTRGRPGMAVNVARIIPVEYSAVTVLTASAPRR